MLYNKQQQEIISTALRKKKKTMRIDGAGKAVSNGGGLLKPVLLRNSCKDGCKDWQPATVFKSIDSLYEANALRVFGYFTRFP